MILHISRGHVVPTMHFYMQNSGLWLSQWAVSILTKFKKQQCFSPTVCFSLYQNLLCQRTKADPEEQNQRAVVCGCILFQGKLCFNAASDSSSLECKATKLSSKIAVSSSSLFHLSPSLPLFLSDIAEQLPFSLSSCTFQDARSNASSTLYFSLAAVKIKYLKTDIHDFCISQID